MLNLNEATFIGVDSHTTEHTALAINRFEEEKGHIRFENSKNGIINFLSWINEINADSKNVVLGVEGGGWEKNILFRRLALKYDEVYEVNPLFTKQRRSFGTKKDKSDKLDAKLIAKVLTKKLNQLPKIHPESLDIDRLLLKKHVWYWEHLVKEGTRIKNQLKALERERSLAEEKEHIKGLDLIIRLKRRELKGIKKYKAILKAKLEDFVGKLGGNLISMPGISTIQAAKIIGFTGPIARFKKADSFCKYAGVVPSERSSGKTIRRIKASTGNRHLNSTFYILALNQIRWDKKAKAYFDKKVSEGKTKKHAIRCLMKRLACITYGMMKSKEDYRN